MAKRSLAAAAKSGDKAQRAAQAVLGMNPTAEPKGKVAVLSTVEMSAPTPGNRPDLLGHPYHDHLAKLGLEGFFSAKDNLDFNATRGFKVFRRPAGVRDEHVIFHGTDGDTVQRGNLILMVRPASQGAREAKANAQAHTDEVAGMVEDANAQMQEHGTRAEGRVSVDPAKFDVTGPTQGEE